MKPSRLIVLALSASALSVHAQAPPMAYRSVVISTEAGKGRALIDVSDLFEPGMTDTASKVFGYPGKRIGMSSAAEPRGMTLTDSERHSRNHRAWGLSLGFETGPVMIRLAHQNKNVAKVAPAMQLGNRMDAKNSIIAANINIGAAKAYAAYSANRGWGSSPLWNPDNPYGAVMATTPSTDSRDVLVGLAIPYGANTTFLASFVRKNDRDLANRDADQFAFGATYAISRKTDFYAAYSHIGLRNGGMIGTSLDSAKGFSAFNIGMRHSF